MRPIPRLMPALITPFDPAGEIDEGAHRANVALLTERGVEGFLIAGSTGEGPYLEPGERRQLVAAARSAAPDAHLVAGISAETVRGAAAQAAEAAEGGADSLLVLTPTTLVRGRDALVAGYFTAVAEGAPLPVLLYTVPKVTGYSLPVEVVSEVAVHPAVMGIKDSGGDPSRIGPLREAGGEGFVVLCGATAALAASVAAGAHGGITANSNYAFPLALAVVDRAAAGESETGQEALSALAAAVEQHGVPGAKAAAALTGLQAGAPRAPLRPPDAAALAGIEAALQSAGLI